MAAALYRERCLCNEVIFDWSMASATLSQDELVISLEKDMISTIDRLKTLRSSDAREVMLKRIEFLRVSIVRARLGKDMISLAFPMKQSA